MRNKEFNGVNYIDISRGTGIRGFKYPRGYDAANGNFKVDSRAITVATMHTDPRIVVGELVRNMWAPSLQHGFVNRILPIIDPRSNRRMGGVFGEMGSGKSFGGKQLAFIFGVPLQVVDCASKDLNFLQVQTVAESGSKSLYHKLESKFGLEPTTVADLKSTFGEAFSYNNGRAVFIREKLQELIAGKQIEIEKAKRILQESCIMEGLPVHASSDLIFNDIPGPLLTATGPQLLDEYTSGLPGSAKSANMLLEVFAGLTKEHTVNVSSAHNITIRNEELEAGRFIIMTGNMPKDGLGTSVLDASLYRRIDPVFVGAPSRFDREHSIGRYLTGLPLNSIIMLTDSDITKNATAFAAQLEDIRRLGLSEAEQKNIQAFQFTLLENWRKTGLATAKLAEFFTVVDRVTDPETVFHDANIDPDIQHAVTAEYRQQLALDQTIMDRALQRAIYQAAQSNEHMEEVFGSYLVEQVIAIIDEITTPFGINKQPLAKHLYAAAQSIGITTAQTFFEAKPLPGGLEELLNSVSNEGTIRGYEDIRLRILALLRQQQPDIKDDYITNKGIYSAVRNLAKIYETMDRSATSLVAPNIGIGSNFQQYPLSRFIIQDPVDSVKLEPDNLMDMESFAVALAFPKINPDFKLRNLMVESSGDLLAKQKEHCAKLLQELADVKILTNDLNAQSKSVGITAQIKTAQKVFDDMENMLAKNNMVTCTYACKNSNSPDGISHTHLFLNTESDRAIMVGTDLDANLVEALRLRGIKYFSYSNPEQSIELETALDDVIKSSHDPETVDDIPVEDIKTYLKYSMLLRNKPHPQVNVQDQNLGNIALYRGSLTATDAVEVTNLKSLDDLKNLRAQLTKSRAATVELTS